MLDWLLNGGYFSIFSVHLAALAVCCLGGLPAALKRLNPKDLLIMALLAAASWMICSVSNPAVNVCCDEFYYSSTARNTVEAGKVYPLIYKYGAASPEVFKSFVPPYPQGWSCLQACMLKLSAFFGGGDFTEGAAIWRGAVSLNRAIYILTPVVLFLTLRLSLEGLPSGAAALGCVFLPFLLKLSSGGSAELACLWGAVLFVFFLQLWHNEGGFKWLFCLGTAGAFWAEMRPEGAVGAFLLLALSILAQKYYQLRDEGSALKPFKDYVLRLSGTLKAEIPGLLLFAATFILWWWPGLAAIVCHPPQLDHHFQMIPRAGFTVWENRFINIVNDLRFFADNKLFPVSLTLLALAGLLPAGGRKFGALTAAFWLWSAAMTLFLSMFPFGDYTSEYSFDSWRFAYVIVIPWAVWAARGADALLRNARGRFAVLLCLGLAVYKALTFAPPKGCAVLSEWDAFAGRCAERVNSDVRGCPLLCSDAEMCLFFREKFGRAAFLYDGKAEEAEAFYLCLSGEKGEYDYYRWYGRNIRLLDECREVDWGFFLLERE